CQVYDSSANLFF
nr:immunoglobulin light chain junction region [Macaca mulatta]MPN65240.1 immunoglobulin light chain junction region [Macaca mulatta]MPN65260.1 immunoglobulin light chain junction region [Macaca mulatta]MPN65263.1 immunoglobulin light chain junction region [Macaca mulatta]MPN65273.1 immunoglobulin light chain junction region [Macaca mulatta]